MINLAWGAGVGINFSQQADDNRFASSFWCPQGIHDGCIANDSKRSLCLRNEISETNNTFTDNCPSQGEKTYVEEYKSQIQIPPKENCVIM